MHRFHAHLARHGRRALACGLAVLLAVSVLLVGFEAVTAHAAPAATVASELFELHAQDDVGCGHQGGATVVIDHQCHGCVQLDAPARADTGAFAGRRLARLAAVTPWLDGMAPALPARPPKDLLIA